MIFIYFISILAVFVVIYLIFTFVNKKTLKHSKIRPNDKSSSLAQVNEKPLTIGQIFKSCDSSGSLYVEATELLGRLQAVLTRKATQTETSNDNIVEFHEFINDKEYLPLQELVNTLIEEIGTTDTFIVKEQDLKIRGNHLYYCCWVEYDGSTRFYLETEVKHNSGKICEAFAEWKHNRQNIENYKRLIDPDHASLSAESKNIDKVLLKI